MEIKPMRNLVITTLAVIFLALFSIQTYAAKPSKTQKPSQSVAEEKEGVVLMPLRLSGADKAVLAAMEASIVKGLQ
ncbi:MAG: hypothetical protein WCI39_14045, partial [Gallionellaceae bacterium]